MAFAARLKHKAFTYQIRGEHYSTVCFSGKDDARFTHPRYGKLKIE